MAQPTLPRRVPLRPVLPPQENVPPSLAEREAIRARAYQYLQGETIVPPLPMDELKERAAALCAEMGTDRRYVDFVTVALNNALWRETLAAIPYERRLLLLPKCLRVESKCPGTFDGLGLLCKGCGLCAIRDLQEEAERLGYAVLVAEGSPVVAAMIESGQIEAIVGVSCLNVLEKVYQYMEAAAVPGLAVPLLRDGCKDTSVDLDPVWEMIHLTSVDRTRRMDLTGLRDEIDTWFRPESLAAILGPPTTETEAIGHDWLARAGKRWRPFLSVAIHQALGDEPGDEPPGPLRAIAVAVECFHKASLIHDDIEDEDDLRYGRETLHRQYGVPVALNAGDYLIGEGYRLLATVDVPAACRAEMLRVAAEGHRTLCLGQGAELAWMRDPRPLRPLEVIDVFRRKTAPAFEIALRLGAIYAGADPALGEALHDYSEALGIAYQIRDDLEELREGAATREIPELRPTIVWALAHQRARREQKDRVAATWCGGSAAMDAAFLHRLLAELEVERRGRELLEAYKAEAVRTLGSLANANVKGLLRRTIGKIFNELELEGWCDEFAARHAASLEPRAAVAG